VTNETDSELARAADLTLPLAAGPDRAVAASKTYVNQLAAILLLAGAVAGRASEIVDQIGRTAESMAEALPASRTPSLRSQARSHTLAACT
jgi:Glucosamine 6-phosphate synthetase, contains amidotransferase and phosphosugar isomerase domains